jgi:hypothetical protein
VVRTRKLRSPHPGLLLAGLILVLAVVEPVGRAAQPRQGGPRFVTLLPLAWQGLGQAGIPRPPTAVAPTRPVTGSLVLAQGAEVVGGPVGQRIHIAAELAASSPLGPVTEMRLEAAAGCHGLPGDLAGPWEPFEAHRDFAYTIQVPNFVGFYARAQFRDAGGHLSPVVCDDVAVEGWLPTPSRPAPTEPVPTEPAPTVTPTSAPPAGRVVGRLLVSGAPAVEGTGLVGPALWLRRCDGADCGNLLRSGVLGDAGRYAFDGVPALAPGEHYQVFWQNEDSGEVFGDERLLGSWYGRPIAAFDGQGEHDAGDIELADLVLLRPTHGTGFQGLPIQFGWQVRPGTETYRWGLTRGCGLLATRPAALLTPSLGRGDSYALTRYPPDVRFGNDNVYCWFVRIETADGYGESYYARMMWFIPPLLAGVPAGWPASDHVEPSGRRP